MINPKDLKLKNIRLHGNKYAVRFTKRVKTFSDAKKVKKLFNKYIDNVGIYQDVKANNFMVQTYKEYKSLEDAIKVRDYIKDCKEIWDAEFR